MVLGGESSGTLWAGIRGCVGVKVEWPSVTIERDQCNLDNKTYETCIECKLFCSLSGKISLSVSWGTLSSSFGGYGTIEASVTLELCIKCDTSGCSLQRVDLCGNFKFSANVDLGPIGFAWAPINYTGCLL